MKEINIDTKTLVEAPIDDKNVMSDWLVDTLFDEQEYTGYGHEYMGFVGGYPTFLTFYDNKADIRFLHLPKCADDFEKWRSAIIGKLAEVTDKSAKALLWCLDFRSSIQYIADPVGDGDAVHILTLDAYDDFVFLKFHWNTLK